MKIYTSINDRADTCVVALGCFDGVHLGHARVIGLAKEIACERSLPLTVWSFEEPPRNFFSRGSVPLITEPREKRSLMRKLGVDTLFSIKFNKDIADLSAEDFFNEILIDRLNAAHIVCGFNFNFGARGQGDPTLLKKLCDAKGIGLSVVSSVSTDGKEVSSSAIRSAIASGDTAQIASLLGRPYSLRAPVVNGQHLARDLGFPTANQIYPKKKAVLRYGVYKVRVRMSGKTYKGISNVGMRPTVNGSLLCVETHVLGFCGDLYGKYMTVEFLEFIRPEQKFASISELEEHIRHDVQLVSRS